MDLELTPTQELLQATAADLLEREAPFERTRELERTGRSDEVLWRAICRQGWLGVAVGEACGGAGESVVDLGLLVEAVARRAAIVPLLEVAVCMHVIERHAAPDRASSLIGDVLEGEVIVVPAVLEDDDRFGTGTAELDEAGRLSGHKSFVDHARMATHHLVSARDAEGPGLFLVSTRGEGVELAALENVGWTPSARVVYARAPAERIAAGETALLELVRLARALAAVQVSACMGRSLEGAVEYAKLREQFGKPIGSFQAVRHHCANMAIRVASARWLAFEALSALEVCGRSGGTEAADRLVATAKASASRAAPEVTMLAHQIFGGNGVILENDHYFFTLRARERALAWGTLDECLASMAEGVSAENDWL
jgi:alkylation response protein AidB-like acyl-CoA dehydrogenase